MGFTYHLVSNTGRYVRLSGPASALVVEAELVIEPGLANPIKWTIFSTDGGQTLYAGGQWAPVSNPDTASLHKSIDRGATWVNIWDKLPSPPSTYYMVECLHGWPDDPSLILSFDQYSAADGFMKLNTATGLWEIKQNTVARQPNSCYAVPGTDLAYGVTHIGSGGNQLWYSTDRGVIWTEDPTFEAVCPGDPLFVTVSPIDGRIFVLVFASGPNVLQHGFVGGPWTLQTLPTVSDVIDNRAGPYLGADETGAIWMVVDDTISKVLRRDPTSGVISDMSAPMIGGYQGGLFVINSQNVMTVQDGRIVVTENGGVDWYAYAPQGDLGLTDNQFWGIWGEAPDEAPPVITLVEPQEDSEVPKQGNLTFKALDLVGDIVVLTATLNGRLIYSLASGFLAKGFQGTTIDRVIGVEGSGYQVSLIPDRLSTWRNSEPLRLVVHAEDGSGNEASEAWNFEAVPRIVPPVFSYLIESIQNEDIKD